MGIWRISMLGAEAVQSWRGDKVDLPDNFWLLLGHLLANSRRRINRAQLAGELWPERSEESARHCLASALWRIRKLIPCFGDLLVSEGEGLALRSRRDIWIDSLAFETRARQLLRQPELHDPASRARYKRTITSYTGDFLLGREGEAIAVERERLRALYLDAGYQLACTFARYGEWQDTLEICRSLCAAEPLREDVQRLLIEACLASGNRALAVQQYHGFARYLASELQVEPMAETRALISQIVAPPRTNPPHAEPLPFDRLASPPRDAGEARSILLQARAQMVSTLSLIDSALAR